MTLFCMIIMSTFLATKSLWNIFFPKDVASFYDIFMSEFPLMRHKIISSLTYIFHFMNVLRKFLPSMEKAPVNFSSLFVRKDIITNVSSRNIVIHINIFLIFSVSKFQFISTLHAPVQSSVLPLLLFLCHVLMTRHELLHIYSG